MSSDNKPSETKPTSTGPRPKPEGITRPAPLGNIHTHSHNTDGVSTPESANNKRCGK